MELSESTVKNKLLDQILEDGFPFRPKNILENYMIPVSMALYEKQTFRSKLLWSVIRYHCGRGDECFLSDSLLMRKLRIEKRRLDQLIQELRELALIEIESKYKNTINDRVCVYKILWSTEILGPSLRRSMTGLTEEEARSGEFLVETEKEGKFLSEEKKENFCEKEGKFLSSPYIAKENLFKEKSTVLFFPTKVQNEDYDPSQEKDPTQPTPATALNSTSVKTHPPTPFPGEDKLVHDEDQSNDKDLVQSLKGAVRRSRVRVQSWNNRENGSAIESLAKLAERYGVAAVVHEFEWFLSRWDKTSRYKPLPSFARIAAESLQDAPEASVVPVARVKPIRRAQPAPGANTAISTLQEWIEKSVKHLTSPKITRVEPWMGNIAAERALESEFVDNLDWLLSKCDEISAKGKYQIGLKWLLDKGNYQKLLSEKNGPVKAVQAKKENSSAMDNDRTRLRLKVISQEEFDRKWGKISE